MMSDDETRIMDRLADLVAAPHARRFLEGVAFALRRQLADDPDAHSTQAALPLDIYGETLPGGIRSSWVFVLRSGIDHPGERHPNSIQRMFALDSEAAMEVWTDEGWSLRPLSPGGPGLSIPLYAWHRPARLDTVWGVVSFHTVAAEDLVEETGDPAGNETGASRHYIRA